MEHSVLEWYQKLVYKFSQKFQKDFFTLETRNENTEYRIR
jgi:hypothetical protein